MQDRVETRQADMADLPFAGRSFDLIWCEGAAYIIGFSNALEAWKKFLKPGGRLALTEAVWLKADPPASLAAFWDAGYPAMTDVRGCRRMITAAGLHPIGDFVLPAAAWWDDYYAPMEVRVRELDAKYAGDAVAQDVLQECRTEIDMFRTYADFYGYAFFIMATAPAEEC